MRVPFWAALALVIMAAAGIAGYFVPLDRLILTEQELAQKKSLEEQNSRLQNNIGTTLRMLSVLRERTERLNIYKEQNRDVIGLPQAPQPRPEGRQRAAPQPALSPSAVLKHVEDSERFIAGFASSATSGRKSLFDTIPIARPIAPSSSVMSRQFGMGRDPFTGKQMMHYGIDIAAEIGTPVVATASGVVQSVENDPIWGRRVVIAHGRGFRTVYAHLGTVSAVRGKVVERGEEIGTIGMTGLATGPHVHYEIWMGDRQVDPEEYFFPVMLLAQE